MPGIYGQLVKAQAENLSSDPSAGLPGRLIWNTADTALKVDTGTTLVALASATKLSGMFPLILGSSSQVTAGIATHSTWSSMVTAASNGDFVLVLEGSWTENVSISKRLCILGQGSGSVIDGTLTFTSAADQTIMQFFKINDNITFNSSADSIILTDFIQATAKTITDNGTGNFVQGLRL